MSRPRGASPYDMHEWARLQARKHRLSPRTAHVLLVLVGYAHRHDLKAWPSIASLARDCGLKLSRYEMKATDRGEDATRTVTRNSSVSASLKQLEELDLIRICPRGRGLSNYYYVHFEKPSDQELIAHGLRRSKEYDSAYSSATDEQAEPVPDASLEYDQEDSSGLKEYDHADPGVRQADHEPEVENAPVEKTGQPEPGRDRSTTGRTPESHPDRTPDDNNGIDDGHAPTQDAGADAEAETVSYERLVEMKEAALGRRAA